MTIASDIDNSPKANPSMGLIHTTSVSLFRKICTESDGKLVPQTCPVMAVALTYLFYGRPAYRPGPIAPTDRDGDSRPVCMLFDKEAVGSLYGLYPCDTGAHKRGFYHPHLGGIDFPELDCVSVLDAEQKIVSRYFSSNSSYFFGEERASLSPAPTSATAKSYYELLRSHNVTEYDDRSRTIELTTNAALDLTTALRTVIAPDFLWAEPDIISIIEAWEANGVIVKPYRPQSQTNAARTVERLFDTVGQLQGIAA